MTTTHHSHPFVYQCLDATEDSLTISWDAIDGATQEKYEVQWRLEGSGDDFAPLGSKGFTNRCFFLQEEASSIQISTRHLKSRVAGC